MSLESIKVLILFSECSSTLHCQSYSLFYLIRFSEVLKVEGVTQVLDEVDVVFSRFFWWTRVCFVIFDFGFHSERLSLCSCSVRAPPFLLAMRRLYNKPGAKKKIAVHFAFNRFQSVRGSGFRLEFRAAEAALRIFDCGIGKRIRFVSRLSYLQDLRAMFLQWRKREYLTLLSSFPTV